MSSYKVEQRRLSFRGRDFHFVSYEGRPANERRGEEASPPMWYLMGPAKRWPVMPQVAGPGGRRGRSRTAQLAHASGIRQGGEWVSR